MTVREAMTPIPDPLEPGTPLLEAARRMAAARIPVLPVCTDGRLVGILSERALVLGAVAEDSDGDAVPATEGRVERAMIPSRAVCREDEEVEAVLARLQGTGTRHVVVEDADGKVTGVLALRPQWSSQAPDEGIYG